MSRYQNAATTKGMLSRDPSQRALHTWNARKRCALSPCLKASQVWVKCKDQVQSGMQRNGVMLRQLLHEAGSWASLPADDLFILMAMLTAQATTAGLCSITRRKPHSFTLAGFEDALTAYAGETDQTRTT